MINAVMVIIVALSVLTGAPVLAQSSAYNDGENGVSRHHLMPSEMMKGMIEQMSQMSDEMSQPLTPGQSKQMARRMEQMSKLMHRMAGLEARPAMQEMEKMRQEMDEWRANPPMVPDGSSHIGR